MVLSEREKELLEKMEKSIKDTERTGDIDNTGSEYKKLKPKIKEFEHKQKMAKLLEKKKQAGMRHERAKTRQQIRELKKKTRRMDRDGGIARIILGPPSKRTKSKSYTPKKKKKPKTQYHVVGGKAYPIQPSKRKKKTKKKSSSHKRSGPGDWDWMNPTGGKRF